jgi:hypothetical protein
LESAEAGDGAGLALFSELSVAQCGRRWAGVVLHELPTICKPAAVPIVLQVLHQSNWINVAREVVIQAVAQLSKFDFTLGKDISFSSDRDGVPVLHMTPAAHFSLVTFAPHSLQLISAFLRVE